MIDLQGKYNTAKVFTDNVESEAISQIIELLNQEFVAGSKVRIMPDTHAGAGCTIGTTMTISDKIVPNLVGVDIGCGMHTTILGDKSIDLEKLDKVIREKIPSGYDVRGTDHPYTKLVRIQELRCKDHVSLGRAYFSVGTLGGGNHFIEVDQDDNGTLYLVVHSGSRYLGKQVAEYYQKKAYDAIVSVRQQKLDKVQELKAVGKAHMIEEELRKIKVPTVPKDLAYVEGQDFKDYLHDMEIVQHYASWNRKAMTREIVEAMGLTPMSDFTTIHNYINTDEMILRKGAISAQDGERVLIPINMRDGSLICVGKGNPDWNYSAPHGAGRLMSRSKAKEAITLEEYQKSMEGIYSTSVSQSTLDESPMAYKPMEEIIENVKDSVDILMTIKPIYNFKAN